MARTKYHDARDGRVRLNLNPNSLLKADRVDGLGAGDSSLTLNFLPVATACACVGAASPAEVSAAVAFLSKPSLARPSALLRRASSELLTLTPRR